MRYQGGKSRIATEIAESINQSINQSTTFVSLFCGACSVESKIKADIKICNDKHEYLIEMLKGVQQGYELPDSVSENEHKYIKENKDKNKFLAGFVGFGCSFGGKWFGGYARNKTNTNYAAQSKKSLLKDMEHMKDSKFICKDYREVEIPDDAIIYADPPYDKTTGYGHEKFNSKEFWEYMRLLSKTHMVYISEQHAPNDFICIWEKPFTRTLDVNKDNQFQITEKLFIHKDNLSSISEDQIKVKELSSIA